MNRGHPDTKRPTMEPANAPGGEETAIQVASRFFGLSSDLLPRRMVPGAVLFVTAAARSASGVAWLRLVAAALWLVAAFLAIRGWLRVMRARRRRDAPTGAAPDDA